MVRYHRFEAMDARGNVIEATMGNGMQVLAFHDADTGALVNRVDYHKGTGLFGQLVDYEWDQIGNLVRRSQAAAGSYQEDFVYDHRNRLLQVHERSGDGMWELAQELRYDLSGNILCKSDVMADNSCSSASDAHYTYNTGSQNYNAPGPHAVQHVQTDIDTCRNFDYDANGNVIEEWVTSSGGSAERQMTYTASNLLRQVTTGNQYSEFVYGTDRQRVIRRDGQHGTGVERRVHYIGSVEVVYNGSDEDPAQIRRYIAGVAIMSIQGLEEFDSGIERTRYQHLDHLGSITALSDEFGYVDSRASFDAWGKRRDPQAGQPPWDSWLGAPPTWALVMAVWTDRGYTGHEHLDEHGIIHMNGRIYDAHLGRFLQADPFIEDTGTLNRYTYVHNNPLVYTDPSGYLSLKSVLKIAATVVINVITSGMGSFVAAAIGGALSGYIMTGTLEGAAWGAFSASVFFALGQALPAPAEGARYWSDELINASLANGLAGGTISHLQGGKFGHGFLSAGVSAAASPKINSTDLKPIKQASIAAIVGGSVSSMTGGKFANGAATAAMAHAYKTFRAAGGSGARPAPPPDVVDGGGDVGALQADLANLPPEVLAALVEKEISFVAVQDSIVEYLPHLKGVSPEGWPAGVTWDTVPGVFDEDSRAVVIATSGKYRHGSHNLTLHETGHAYDYATGRMSSSAAFRAARMEDLSGLRPYYLQPGTAGLRETFAESFANFYGGNTGYSKAHPNIWSYWQRR